MPSISKRLSYVITDGCFGREIYDDDKKTLETIRSIQKDRNRTYEALHNKIS